MKDGGLAFPIPDGTNTPVHYGMTLRQWYAGMALMGLSANPQFDVTVDIVSGWAWDQADAMIAHESKCPRFQPKEDE